MAGIYIHIPYCKKACHYCDFHFSTSLKTKSAFIESLINEIKLQKNFFSESNQKETISSVYFGGGTPSLLNENELSQIFDALYHTFDIVRNPEITLEANPDDLTREKIHSLSHSPVNRLSIGVQSFHDEDLLYMNRSHNAQRSLESINDALDAGFENISIDLIYGSPIQSEATWISNLETAFSLNIRHLSCYSLTVEPNTALAHFIRKGTHKNIDEANAAAHYRILLEMIRLHGYRQYEISNFCRESYFSIHNSNYWTGEKYLGLGPSAHSYNGIFRQSNISNNPLYIKSISSGIVPFTPEYLNETEKYNEYILISMRTMWGADPEYIRYRFGESYLNHFNKTAEKYFQNNSLTTVNNSVILTQQGKFFADSITSDLFIFAANGQDS